MRKVNFIYFLALYASFKVEKGSCKIETVRKDPSWRREVHETPRNSVFTKKNSNFRPHLVETGVFSIYPNKTYDFLEFYKEMTAIKNSTEVPLKRAYIDNVLVPKTDAKVAKLQAETAYIETKNAAKKKSMNLMVDDFKKRTVFSDLTGKILNYTAPLNNTEALSAIYNETFYYLNNKNLTENGAETTNAAETIVTNKEDDKKNEESNVQFS